MSDYTIFDVSNSFLKSLFIPMLNPCCGVNYPQFGSRKLKWLKAIILAEAILLDQFWLVIYITSPNMVLFEHFLSLINCSGLYLICYVFWRNQGKN